MDHTRVIRPAAAICASRCLSKKKKKKKKKKKERKKEKKKKKEDSFILSFLRPLLYLLVRYTWQIVYIFVHRRVYYKREEYIIQDRAIRLVPAPWTRGSAWLPSWLPSQFTFLQRFGFPFSGNCWQISLGKFLIARFWFSCVYTCTW